MVNKWWQEVCATLVVVDLDLSWAAPSLEASYGWGRATDDALKVMLPRFRALRTVNVAGHSRLSNAGIMTLGTNYDGATDGAAAATAAADNVDDDNAGSAGADDGSCNSDSAADSSLQWEPGTGVTSTMIPKVTSTVNATLARSAAVTTSSSAASTSASRRPALTSSPLVSANLQHVWELTNHGLIALAGGAPAITRLEIAYCSRLTERGIAQAVCTLPSIQHLNLRGIPLFGDYGATQIALHCHALRYLAFSDAALTNAGVGQIAAGCTK